MIKFGSIDKWRQLVRVVAIASVAALLLVVVGLVEVVWVPFFVAAVLTSGGRYLPTSERAI